MENILLLTFFVALWYVEIVAGFLWFWCNFHLATLWITVHANHRFQIAFANKSLNIWIKFSFWSGRLLNAKGVVFSIVPHFTAQQQSSLEYCLELCYVAIQPCSLDSLIFACTLITVCKKGIFGKQNGWKREQNGWMGKGRFIEHKRKAK